MSLLNRTAPTSRAGRWIGGALVALTLAGISPEAHAQFVVSGWNSARGGPGSDLQNGAGMAKLRSALVTSFGPVNFLGLSLMTTPLLISSNLVVLGVVFDSSTGTPVTPLSSSEQSVLSSFVTRGGRLLLITEGSAYQASSQAMVSWLGINSDGAASCTGDGSIVLDPAACRLSTGVFGSVASPVVSDCLNGWYSSVGSATVQGRWGYNNQPCIVRKTIGSGVVVCVSDAQFVDYQSPTGATLMKNIIASLNVPLRAFAEPQLVPCTSPTATFSLSPGAAGATYQWQKQVSGVWTNLIDGDQAIGGTVVGAQAAAATISNVVGANAGSYRCIVTDACGTAVTTGSVVLNVATGCCPCVADYDGSGGTPDASDIDAFFADWLLGAETSDSDCSGGTPDASDIDLFFTQWLTGGC